MKLKSAYHLLFYCIKTTIWLFTFSILFTSCKLSTSNYNQGYSEGYHAGYDAAKALIKPAQEQKTVDSNFNNVTQEDAIKEVVNTGIPKKVYLVLDFIKKKNELMSSLESLNNEMLENTREFKKDI